MTRGIGTLAGLALVAALLTGCGDDTEGKSGGDPDPTDEATAAPAPDPVAALKLHSTGSGEKRLLSAPFEVGAEERSSSLVVHDISGSASRTRIPQRLAVTEVYDDGSARVELHTGPSTVDGDKGTETFHRWARVTPEGRVLDGGALEGGDPVDPDWDLQRELTAVPDVPVGVGAEWSVRYETEEAGMTFQLTERYRVTALRGDTVTLAQIANERSGTTEASKQEGAEDGLVFAVSGSSHGTGTVTLVLGRLLSAETLDSSLSTTTESTLDGRFNPEDGAPEHEVERSEADFHVEVTVR